MCCAHKSTANDLERNAARRVYRPRRILGWRRKEGRTASGCTGTGVGVGLAGVIVFSHAATCAGVILEPFAAATRLVDLVGRHLPVSGSRVAA